MIQFHLDARSGLTPYQQIVHQVRRALLLGVLVVGDQLPTVKEVAGSMAINPNTVTRAYRELEHAGLVTGRQGVGTFVSATLGEVRAAELGPLRGALEEWVARARSSGLDDEGIEALFDATFRAARRGIA